MMINNKCNKRFNATRTELHPVTKCSTSKTNVLPHNSVHSYLAGHACDICSQNVYKELVHNSTCTQNLYVGCAFLCKFFRVRE